MGETRVDLLHLLEDLRDAYPWSLEETIVTEIVANALDSGAASVAVSLDPAAGTLTVADDGKGMSRQALSRYHDLASTTKRRGVSIGFAGVGIKLGLLLADEVITETRRKRTHLATSWRLSSRNRAPWRWIDPPGMVEREGTSVRLYLTNRLSPLQEPGFIEDILLRQFQPLLDPDFDEILSPFYPDGIGLAVNGRPLHRTAPEPHRAPLSIKIGRQRKTAAAGYLVRDVDGREDGRQEGRQDELGIAVSTLGKVIKRGWDWLGLSAADASGVSGLIEVPQLAEALTLNNRPYRTERSHVPGVPEGRAGGRSGTVSRMGRRDAVTGIPPAAHPSPGAGLAVGSCGPLGRFPSAGHLGGASSGRATSPAPERI
jgi:hypothetical protein